MVQPSQAESEAQVLRRLIDVVFSEGSLDSVLPAVTELILAATHADACFVHMLEENGHKLVLRAASGEFRHMVGQVELDIGEGLAGWAAEHGEAAVIWDDKFSDPRYKYIPELGGDRYTSMISVPLLPPTGRLIGVVNLHTKERREFDDSDVALLRDVASLVAAAIEHAQLVHQLADKERQLQDLFERTLRAQEEERRRLATEIHDGVTQQLISIWYRLNACERLIETAPAEATMELDTAKALVDEALDETRAAIYDLRPTMLDDLGLGPAIEALAHRTLGNGYEAKVETSISRGLPGHLEIAIYRIAQEALNNIRKHAGPCRVEVRLEVDEQRALMTVIDEGKGFDDQDRPPRDPSTTSFGLTGMRERVDLIGGRLRVRSAPGRGTMVALKVPLTKRSDAR